jgi:hypothetical protein
MLIILLRLMPLLNFYMCLSLYMVYMECTLNNFMHLRVHPEQPTIHADQFDVPHDSLELLHVPILVHWAHGGHGVHGLHPAQLHTLISASRTPSCSC